METAQRKENRRPNLCLELLAHIVTKLSLCQNKILQIFWTDTQFCNTDQKIYLSPRVTFTQAWDERGIQRVKLGAKKCRVRKDIAEIMDLVGRGDGSCSWVWPCIWGMYPRTMHSPRPLISGMSLFQGFTPPTLATLFSNAHDLRPSMRPICKGERNRWNQKEEGNNGYSE